MKYAAAMLIHAPTTPRTIPSISSVPILALGSIRVVNEVALGRLELLKAALSESRVKEATTRDG